MSPYLDVHHVLSQVLQIVKVSSHDARKLTRGLLHYHLVLPNVPGREQDPSLVRVVDRFKPSLHPSPNFSKEEAAARFDIFSLSFPL